MGTAIARIFPAVVFAALLFFLPAGSPRVAAGPGLCDIQHGPCTGKTSGGMTIQFDIRPKPVKPLSQLIFFVSVQDHGKAVTDAEVRLDLTMPGMYMGRNAPVMKHVADGRYEGKGIIPRCLTGSKTWQASVSVQDGGAKQAKSFVFEVQ